MFDIFSLTYGWLQQKSATVGKRLQSLTLFILRFYIAGIFLQSGIQKLNQFNSTKLLFAYEYQVPVLSADFAAVLATSAEIILPLLLIFGLFTRLSALFLWFFNIVAVWSYPVLYNGLFSLEMFGPIPLIHFPTKGYEDHVVWGIGLLIIVAFGSGKIALDYLLGKE